MIAKKNRDAGLIAGIIISVAIVVLKLIYDLNLWRKGIQVNHPKEWRIMAVSSLIAIAGFSWYTNLIWYYSIPLSSAMIAFFILNFFNGFYNICRKQKWAFTGSGGKDGAKTDKILAGMKPAFRILVQGVPLVILILLYIFTANSLNTNK